MNRTKQISASVCSYAMVIFLLASPLVSESYAETCVGGTPQICVDFINGGDPVLGFDFNVVGLDVILKTGALDWRVWSSLGTSSSTPADIGSITLNPTVSADDFEVQIKNGMSGGAGALNVGSIVLDDAGFTGFSSLAAGSAIDGNIDGPLKVVTGSGGAGGKLGGLIVLGNVTGPIDARLVSGSNLIGGNVTNAVTLEEIDNGAFVISGDLSANLNVTKRIHDGNLVVAGSVPASVTIQVADIVDDDPAYQSTVSMGTGIFGSTFAGTLILDTGISETNAYVYIFGIFSGELDLTDDAVAGGLSIIGGDGTIVNGGAVSGTVFLGFGPDYDGTVEFTSVSSTGSVDTSAGPTGISDFNGRISITGDMEGWINLYGDFGSTATADGLVSVSGAVLGSINIGGNMVESADIILSTGLVGGNLFVQGDVPIGSSTIFIADMISAGGKHSLVDLQQDFAGALDLQSGIKANQDVRITGEFIWNGMIDLNNGGVAGMLKILGGGDGVITNGGAVSGTVILADGPGEAYSGDADFASVSGAGVIKTVNGAHFIGGLDFTSSCSGDIEIAGNCGGDISIGGGLKGDVDIEGNLHGSITVADSLGNVGRILVEGLTEGTIRIGKKTTGLTLIHLSGGLGEFGTVEINTTEGNFNAEGAIYVGAGAACVLSPPDVTFDGCIRIYDHDPSGNFGNLEGAISISGCHAPPEPGEPNDLNICVDGSDNGNVNICQNGCPNQVGWSCPIPACP